MFTLIVRVFVYLPLLGVLAVVATSCTQLGLNYASLETDNKPAAFPPLAPETAEAWISVDVPAIRAGLEDHVFGPVPTGLASRVVGRMVVDDAYFGGLGTLEEWLVEIGEGVEAVRFHLAVAFPATGDGPAPLVIGQTFSPNQGVMQNWDLSQPFYVGPVAQSADEHGGMMMGAITFIFGQWIEKAPVEQYLERGYAFANFFATEIVPDSAGAGLAALERFPAAPDGRRPTGAVAAWAAGFFAAMDVLDADPRIDPDRTALIGHSRHAKSALVAGGWDERAELVISHQSGTGGASLSRDKPGETVKQITKSYPHWFAPAYAAYAGNEAALPVDQHMLVALIAPRRVLLGNGRRDVWSDPNGAYRAAEAASAAWRVFGQDGLAQDGLRDFNPAGDIAFLTRPGGHGIVGDDIEAFLAFLDASFMSSRDGAGPVVAAPN